MSQIVGQTFQSRIPTLGDDASIVEALMVYHYGVDNYTTQPIPDKSIEGNFRSLDNRIDTLETQVNTIDDGLVKLTSLAVNPNVIISETTTTVPLTVRGIISQTSFLQQWQNSSNTNVAVMSTGGSLGISGYLSLGSTTFSSTTALSLNTIGSTHKGITIRAATSQTANLQEWQSSSESILAVINSMGSFATAGYISSGSSSISSTTSFSTNTLNASHKGIVIRGFSSQTANLQEWQNNSGTVLASINSSGAFSTTSSITTTSSISAVSASISGDLSSGGAITLTSSQTLDSFRVRNIRASTSQPSGGNDGDIWLVYV